MVQVGIAPTRAGEAEYPSATGQVFSLRHPNPAGGPFFSCRILCKEGQWPRPLKSVDALRQAIGVHVYLEGSSPVGTITVAGVGRIRARPDLAVTTVGVEAYAATLSQAMAEAGGTMGSGAAWPARCGASRHRPAHSPPLGPGRAPARPEERTILRLCRL